MSESDYAKQYYKKNKQKIAARKRARYRLDPEYREKVKEQARCRSRKLIAQNPRGRTTYNRGDQIFYSFSHVVSAIGRHSQTVTNYIRRGIIPDSGYSLSNGRRYYTQQQLDILSRVFSEHEKGCSLETVAKRIQQDWIAGDNEILY